MADAAAAPVIFPVPDIGMDEWEWDGLELPEALREIAAKEINETDQKRVEGLEYLRAQIATLPPAERPKDQSDRFLLCFLRARKFRFEQVLV